MNIIQKTIILLLLTFMALPAFAADYYWVGGSGNWSDVPNHWRTSSGGTSIPGVVPGPTDNVFFDVNSGFTSANKTVTLDVIGNVRNITFEGSAFAPIVGASNRLNIYGSSVWQSGMSLNLQVVYQNTNMAKTIKSNGVKTRSTTILEEKSVDLLDDFSSEVISHQAGTWNTNNHKVTTGDYTANTVGSPVTINLGSSEFYTSVRFDTSRSGVTVNGGTSHLQFIEITGIGTTPTLSAGVGQSFHDVSFKSIDRRSAISGSNTSFNNVKFSGDGTLNGNMEFKELFFSPSRSYGLGAGKITVKNKFTAFTTACTPYGKIAGIVGTIISAPNTATISVSGTTIQGMKAEGGAIFNALSSLNLGNNSGWNFPSSPVKSLYWVGGSGDYNDRTHWSQSSGGTGGFCIPGATDDVIFDNSSGFSNSSKTITLNTEGYARNINFAGNVSANAPIFTGPISTKLNIYGSSVWQTNMTINVRTLTYRNTNSAKTLKSNGVVTSSTIELEETTSVSLLDNLSTNNLIHRQGTWNTNGHNVTTGGYVQERSGNASILANLGISNIYIISRSGKFDSRQGSINAGTSHLHFTNTEKGYFGSEPSGGLLTASTQVYYDVSFERADGAARLGGSSTSSYNKVTFLGDGFISGDNTFKELFFSASKSYILPPAKTQKISQKFTALTPPCVPFGNIYSGSQATISAPAGAVIAVSGTALKNLKAIGGANFTATSSIDLENNTGWTFSSSPAVQNLYWVGGSGDFNDRAHWSQTSGGPGGYCIPSNTDNVFFDANSGFTVSSKTVTLNNISYTRNITFEGNTIAPTLIGNYENYLNIYGSSVWQNGMMINIREIYYRNNDTPKTIMSNGVKTGYRVTLEEKTSVSFLDNFSTDDLKQSAGTWNTNNHTVTIEYFNQYPRITSPITINLGNSNIYLDGFSSEFSTRYPTATLNAGTSHIHFNEGGTGTLSPFGGHIFHNVSFKGTGFIDRLSNISETVYFNKVNFVNDGYINGNNQFKELTFSAGKFYRLEGGKTQKITEKLTLGGTPCAVTTVEGSSSVTKALLDVAGGPTDFNFGNIKNINATTQLSFGEQSTVANQNNTNIIYKPYNPGIFEGLGADWLCHHIDLTDSTKNIISTASYYGNENTQYKWFKLDDPAYPATTPISTAANLDITPFGYGTYRVEVNYEDNSMISCTAVDDIVVSFCKNLFHANPQIKVRVSQ